MSDSQITDQEFALFQRLIYKIAGISLSEAKKVLRIAVARDNDNPFAWYQLGIVYEHEGDRPRAALATAERYSLEGQAAPALHSAEQAMTGLEKGTPDWIRAQDIAMVSKNALEKRKRR